MVNLNVQGKIQNFSVSIKKELDNDKTITYRLKFIDHSFRKTNYQNFLITYLKFTKKNSKEAQKQKNIKSECNFIGLKLHYKCKERRKICFISIKGSIQKFTTMNQLCNGDINKFVLLRKGVYRYEYMDSWERFNEESLPDKETLNSKLNLEDITDEGYAHGQKIQKEFEIKNLDEYHDWYVEGDTFLLADVFENFRSKCIEIFELDPAHFLPGLA